jgi:hypothetical protein
MIAISSSVGLWIIEAYRRMAVQLQLIGVEAGSLEESSVVITETSPIPLKMCLAFVGAPNEQNPTCWISLSDAEFWFDATGDSAGSEGFPSGHWRSFLRVRLSNGWTILLGERFVVS